MGASFSSLNDCPVPSVLAAATIDERISSSADALSWVPAPCSPVVVVFISLVNCVEDETEGETTFSISWFVVTSTARKREIVGLLG